MRLAAGGLAVLSGLLLYAGHPPLDVGVAGLVALAPLVAALRIAGRSAHPLRDGAALGGLTGVVFFGFLVNWILRFGAVPVVLLVLIQALFVAAYGTIVAGYGERRGRGVVAVVAWAGLEVLRSTFPLTGFPWGVLGATQHAGGPLLPVARVGGVILLGAVLAATSVAIESLAVAAWRAARSRDRATDPAQARRAGPVGALASLVAVAVLLPVLPAPPEPTGESIDVAAVQGNDIELPPAVDRLNRVRIERVVERMTIATERLADGPAPDLTIWPENSLDNDFRDVPTLRRLLDRARAAVDDNPLIAGTLLDGPRPDTAYNTLVLIGEDGDIDESYVKRALVPFGEYVPLRSWLDWFPPLEQVPVDYLPGEGPEVFEVEGAVVGPVTCFESIFGDIVHDQVRAGAEMLMVSTNNASFGRTAASRQHLAFSQIRAVETGRYVVHAGISGLSAIVTPAGEVEQRTELFEQAIVRADVPLTRVQTPATALMPWVERAALLGLAAAVVATVAARRHRPSPREAPTASSAARVDAVSPRR